MSEYPNPYEFVPLENNDPVRRKWDPASDGIERRHPERYSGRLHCVLHPETPLFVHGEGQQRGRHRRFFRLNGRPGISASSLKGAVRSVFEIVSDSCLSALNERYRVPGSHQRTYGRGFSRQEFQRLHPTYKPEEHVPKPYHPCTSLDQACPGCLLFGMVEEKQEGRPLAGRLLFSNAKPVEVRSVQLQIPGAAGGPHPWHSTFYFQDEGEGEILGRKLYFHHQDYGETLKLYGDGGYAGLWEIEAQLGDFSFHVDFINLTEDELAYLAYTLVLEEEIRHHLGYGKPYGLGSARILVKRLALWHAPALNGNARFLQLDPDEPATEPVDEWAAEGKDNWLGRDGADPAYEDFARILVWPGADLYQYPDFGWFRRTSGSENVTLAEYQAGVRQKKPAPTPGGRQRGRVVFFKREKGWGFIRADSGEELFVHYSEIRGTGSRSLDPGDRVEFKRQEGERGPRAHDVVVLSSKG